MTGLIIIVILPYALLKPKDTHPVVRVPLVELEPTSGGTQRSVAPFILTLWWYLERQIFSEMVLGVKRLRSTVIGRSR